MKKKDAITIEFGALSQPLSVQLACQGLQCLAIERYETWADYIADLYVVGLLSDSETQRARKRLMRRIIDTSTSTSKDGD